MRSASCLVNMRLCMRAHHCDCWRTAARSDSCCCRGEAVSVANANSLVVAASATLLDIDCRAVSRSILSVLGGKGSSCLLMLMLRCLHVLCLLKVHLALLRLRDKLGCNAFTH